MHGETDKKTQPASITRLIALLSSIKQARKNNNVSTLLCAVLYWKEVYGARRRRSPSQMNLGWSNTSAQTETCGGNTGGISVKELVGPSRRGAFPTLRGATGRTAPSRCEACLLLARSKSHRNHVTRLLLQQIQTAWRRKPLKNPMAEQD